MASFWTKDRLEKVQIMGFKVLPCQCYHSLKYPSANTGKYKVENPLFHLFSLEFNTNKMMSTQNMYRSILQM